MIRADSIQFIDSESRHPSEDLDAIIVSEEQDQPEEEEEEAAKSGGRSDLAKKILEAMSYCLFRRKRVLPITEKQNPAIELSQLEELPRLVSKSGQYRVSTKNVPNEHESFFKDIFTTLVDISWRFTLLAFFGSFLFSWLMFAVFWYLVSLGHGDFEEANISDEQFIPCVREISGFTSCFLFSIETQHTIGYGSRSITEECPHAIILMALQSIIGVLFSSCMAGIVFAKLARPMKRSHTVAFSEHAIIQMINHKLYLMCRFENYRKSQLIESHVRGFYAWPRQTEDGHILMDKQEIKLSAWPDVVSERCVTLLPTTLYHEINQDSPLYELSPGSLSQCRFEVIVMLEGIVEPTGNTLQARTSYLPSEIFWGYKFSDMMVLDKKSRNFVTDCAQLNVLHVDPETPRQSMKTLQLRAFSGGSHPGEDVSCQ